LSMTISTRRQPLTKREPNESYYQQGFKKRHM
jgi:hypothetical protein